MDLEKLDLRSHDLTEDKKQELLRIFPEIKTEGGKIDFDRLELILGETVDVGKERYGMNWPGKADCFKTIQSPSMGTLRPCPEESVNFDTTENMLIEGDNLEVLKLLQKSFLGKIKMIYIDPPYNTGSDFIYPDNYTESLQTYLEYTGQVDSQGKKFSTNTEADGRFHSKWLNMMYPRLYLARNLLRDDGIIFISIDDNEVHNLRLLMNEVFGEENFIASLIWEKIHSTKNDAKYYSENHEYILCYCRNMNNIKIELLPRTEEMNERYQNPDNDGRGPWSSGDLVATGERRDGHYIVKGPTGKSFDVPTGKHWVTTQENFEELIKDNRIWFGRNGDSFPRMKRFLSEVQQGRKASTLMFNEEVGHNQEATREVKAIFNDKDIFDTPKPLRLLKRLLLLTTKKDKNAIIFDFFAGSCSTAHAVLALNKEDGGNRKFICAQLPEKCDENSEAYRAGYKSIAEIGKERIRRVIKKMNEEDDGKLPFSGDKKPDRGFRVFKLDESNFKTWNANIPMGDVDTLGHQLELHIDHIREGRTTEDILYEILLKSGFPLTTPIEKLTIEGKTVFSAVGGAFFICLERELTLELIRAMAKMKPERIVCLDEGFSGNDQLKANAVQIFKTKGITSFKTV